MTAKSTAMILVFPWLDRWQRAVEPVLAVKAKTLDCWPRVAR